MENYIDETFTMIFENEKMNVFTHQFQPFTIMIINENEQVMIPFMQLSQDPEQSKQMYSQALFNIAQELKAEAVIFTIEAFINKKQEEVKQFDNISIKDLPSSIEVLISICTTKFGETILKCSKIIRDSNNKITEFIDEDTSNLTNIGGRMIIPGWVKHESLH